MNWRRIQVSGVIIPLLLQQPSPSYDFTFFDIPSQSGSRERKRPGEGSSRFHRNRLSLKAQSLFMAVQQHLGSTTHFSDSGIEAVVRAREKT